MALSLTKYAQRRGVSTRAVSKAVAVGRLVDSVARDDEGVPSIADADLADREWDANTKPLPNRVQSQLPSDVPDYNTSRARKEAALARLAEIDVEEREGDLISVAEAKADVIQMITIAKTRILGVPSRMAQRLPHLAGEVVPVLESLLREALEDLADGESA